MKTAEFKYFVLNSFQDWCDGHVQSIRIYPEGSIALWPLQSLVSFEMADRGEGQHPAGRATGVAVDNEGSLFVIDAANCHIYQYRFREKNFERVLCIGDCGIFPGQFNLVFSSPPQFSGSIALDRTTLYISDTGNHRIQAFYRFNYQIRFILGQEIAGAEPSSAKPPGEFHSPTDLSVDSQGHLYVLDYGNQRIQKFNQYGLFLNQLIAYEGKNNLPMQPLNMALDGNDTLFIICEEHKSIIRFDKFGNRLDDIGNFDEIRERMPGNKVNNLEISGIAVDKDNLIYLGEKDPTGSKKLRIHFLDHSGNYIGSFGEYKDVCYQLLSDKDGNIFANCGSDGTIIMFKSDSRYAAHGTYYSKVFEIPETPENIKDEAQWHRAVIDADVPKKTKIEVYYQTSENKYDLELGSDKLKTEWSKLLISHPNAVTSKDGLFLNGIGRYLRMKIEMFGDENDTPKLRQIKIYYPRLSYLRYLPATYQEDTVGREFLKRFLAFFESMSFDMEQKIAGLAMYFDPRATDGEFLNWLGSWLAISWDENWPQLKKREFILGAYNLYKRRGTARGLRDLVEFYTDKKASILEHYRFKNPMVLGSKGNSKIGLSTVVGKRLPGQLVLSEKSRIGDFALEAIKAPPEKPFQVNAFDFTVIADTSELKGKEQTEALQRMIEKEKPAHTCYFLRTSHRTMRLGLHSLVGVDTTLVRGFLPMRLGLKSYLGKDTFLGTRHCIKGTIGTRSKIAVDTVLHG